jgi:hypothetical protein
MADFGLTQQRERRFDNAEGRTDFSPVGRSPVGETEMSPEKLIGTIEQVETHEDDPIDNADDDPWDRLANQFSSLGDKLKSRYRATAGSEGPSEEELKAALRTLGGAWDRLAEALSAAMKDEEVRRSVKQTASSLAEAIGAAFNEIPSYLRKQPPLTDQPSEGIGESDP